MTKAVEQFPAQLKSADRQILADLLDQQVVFVAGMRVN